MILSPPPVLVPPLHVNCRSTLVPVLEGEDMEDVLAEMCRPSVEPKDGESFESGDMRTRTGRIRKPSTTDKSPLERKDCQSYTNYPQWLAKQPAEYQKGILGPQAYAKYKETGDLRTSLGFTGASADTWKPTKKSEAGVTVRDRNTLRPLSAAEKKRFDKDGYETLLWDREDADELVRGMREGEYGKAAVALIEKNNLTDREIAAVHAYTENYFNEVNPHLRSGKPIGPHELPVVVLENALAKLPPHEGTVTRKMIWADDLGELKEKYHVGSTFTNDAFLSTAAEDSSFFGEGDNVTFVIEGKHTGKNISRIAGLSDENEVLFAPGGRFEVKSILEDSDGNLTFTMQERLSGEIAITAKDRVGPAYRAWQEAVIRDEQEGTETRYDLYSEYSSLELVARRDEGYTFDTKAFGEVETTTTKSSRDTYVPLTKTEQASFDEYGHDLLMIDDDHSAEGIMITVYDRPDAYKVINKYGITDDEVVSIHSYTGEYYQVINPELRSGNDLGKDAAVVKTLENGLAKLPPYKGEVMRTLTIDEDMDKFLSKYQVGETVAPKGFLSTSYAEDSEYFVGAGHNIIFRIKDGHSGKQIDMLSGIPNEAEVLFAPGANFKISSVMEIQTPMGEVGYEIEMEEVEAPAITTIVPKPAAKATVKVEPAPEIDKDTTAALKREDDIFAGKIDLKDMTDDEREWATELFGPEETEVKIEKETIATKKVLEEDKEKAIVKLADLQEEVESTKGKPFSEKLSSAEMKEFKDLGYKDMGIDPKKPTNRIKGKVTKLRKQGLTIAEAVTVATYDDAAYEKLNSAILSGEPLSKEMEMQARVLTVANKKLAKKGAIVTDIATAPSAADLKAKIKEAEIVKDKADEALLDHKVDTGEIDAKERAEDVKAGTVPWEDMTASERKVFDEEFGGKEITIEPSDKELSDYRAKDKLSVLDKAELFVKETENDKDAILRELVDIEAELEKNPGDATTRKYVDIIKRKAIIDDEVDRAAELLSKEKEKQEKEIETMAKKLAKAEATFDKEHDIGAEMELLEIKADAEALVEKRGLDKDYFKAKGLEDKVKAAMKEADAASDAYSAKPSEKAVGREEKAKVDLKKAEYELDQYRNLSSSDRKLAAATKAKMDAKEAKDRADTVLRVESERLEDIEDELYSAKDLSTKETKELEEYAEEVRDSLMEAKTDYDETSRLYDVAYLEEEKVLAKSDRPRQATIPSIIHTQKVSGNTKTKQLASIDRLVGVPYDREGNTFTKKKIDAWVEKELEGIKNSYVHTRVDSETTLEAILSSNRFKTQFETGASKGMYDPDRRIIAEENMFGLPTDLSPKDRPYYGYLSDTKNGHLDKHRSADQYGDISITFKSSIKERTTWTGEDSLNEALYGDNNYVPSSVLNPKKETFIMRNAHAVSTFIDSGNPANGLNTKNYIEAQMFGGVSVSDIDTVYFSAEPNARLKRMLDEAGIDYEVVEKY